MRDSSPNTFFTTDPLSGFRSEAKSLFRNILHVTPYGSGFCLGSALSRPRKFLEMNILGKRIEKNIERYTHTNLTLVAQELGCARRTAESLP